MTTNNSVPTESVLLEEVIPGGTMWSYVLKRHHILRLTDLQGGANVGTMLYNRDHFLERLNLPDTLKAQHTAKLTTGFVLYSDMGRVLCSIVADSCGWHDPLSGHSNRKLVEQKYGPSRYQEARNDFYRNAHDQFLIELGKWGLGKPDLVANVNFFSKVTVNEQGSMQFVPNNSRPGDYVELRAEMNVLVVLNTCPHPMDPNPVYQPRPVELMVYPRPAVASDDECRTSCEENVRGSILTDALFH